MTEVNNGRWLRFKPTRKHVGGIVFAPPGKDLPLVVALHGCDQNAADFALGTRFAELGAERGFAVLFPETRRTPADTHLNPYHCWIWWAKENQIRGGEPASILALVDVASRTLGDVVLDLDRACVTGMSSGAAMATILAAVYPERFRAAAMHAGVAFGAADADKPQLPSWMTGETAGAADLMALTPLNMLNLTTWASEAMRALEQADHDGEAAAERIIAERAKASLVVPSLVVHGDADDVVDPKNARQLVLQLLQVADLVDNEADDQSVDTRADASSESRGGTGDYRVRTSDYHDAAGALVVRLVRIGRLKHAWSGGHPAGSYTDPDGPDGTRLTWEFFEEQLQRKERGTTRVPKR
jgi:poly(hydroxyalkanoate) depolymerase family esterase